MDFDKLSLRGIGQCYSRKVIRNGIRVCDLNHMDTFPDKLDLSFQWFVIHLISRLWIILPDNKWEKYWGFQHPDHNLSLLSHLQELQHVFEFSLFIAKIRNIFISFAQK
uniref:Uncharacterized protein n=1 Tax=Lactuca sativa TaxID=4236 RepID=A0A9R1UHE1_LACSA|nr:hypothetical protein LSAT_V11C900487810 [Lactuca sativa]